MQRTRHDARVCNPCVPSAGSLSLGRWVAESEPMADDVSFVCFRSGRCDLNGAVKAFVGLKLLVERCGDELAVHYSDGPVLRVAYAADNYVAEENAEIAQRHPRAAALLPCDARFEVMIDDLDATLQEYSTLFAVQEALVEATGGFVFNTWNCGFPWSE